MAHVMAAHAGSGLPLPPCPSSPNCVSSQSSGYHAIEPFTLIGETNAAFESIKEILEQRQDTTIVSADDWAVVVEFTTLLGFVDDGLFVLDAEKRVIHVRSASRAGFWDLGKNRRRMESIRHQYQNSVRQH